MYCKCTPEKRFSVESGPEAIALVADTEICACKHTLGMASEVRGRHRELFPVTLCRPVKLLEIPLASVTTTSKYSTGNSSWEYALMHKELPSYVTSGALGGPTIQCL